MNDFPLFTGIPAETPPPVETRQKVIKRVFERADKFVLAKYEEVVRSMVVPFVAADTTAIYEARYGELAEHNAKGLGYLFGDLQRRGVIEKTGAARPRKNGNASFEYRVSSRSY